MVSKNMVDGKVSKKKKKVGGGFLEL